MKKATIEKTQSIGRPARRRASSPANDAFASVILTDHGSIAVLQSKITGLPFIFLHGNSSCKEIFSSQLVSQFARTHRLVAIDLPGHGGSNDALDPARTYSIPGYADAVTQVIEALGFDQVVIVGWSLGGHVAIELMASFPGVVGVFIIGTPPIGHRLEDLHEAFQPHPSAALLVSEALDKKAMSELAASVLGEHFADMGVPAIERTDGRARVMLFQSLLSGSFEDEKAVIERSEIPLAIVVGEDDPFINQKYVQDLRCANLWGERCHIITDAGHAPFLGNPERFDCLLSKFACDMEDRAIEIRDNPILTLCG